MVSFWDQQQQQQHNEINNNNNSNNNNNNNNNNNSNNNNNNSNNNNNDINNNNNKNNIFMEKGSFLLAVQSHQDAPNLVSIEERGFVDEDNLRKMHGCTSESEMDGYRERMVTEDCIDGFEEKYVKEMTNDLDCVDDHVMNEGCSDLEDVYHFDGGHSVSSKNLTRTNYDWIYKYNESFKWEFKICIVSTYWTVVIQKCEVCIDSNFDNDEIKTLTIL